MARNNQSLIIGAAALGGIALLATMYTLFSGGNAPPGPPNAGGAANTVPAPEATKTRFLAINNIPPRTLLTPAMFRSEQVPASQATGSDITDPNQLSGLLSKKPIPSGSAATTDVTTQPLQRAISANIPIPQGSRAVAIYVDPKQTAAGLVDVGDHVDVIATHKFALTATTNTRVEGATSITAGRVIGQDLLVLAVEQSIEAPAPTPTPAAGAPGAAGAPPAPAVPTPAPQPGQEVKIRVLLAAPLEVAARLVAAEEEGKLHVVIRNPSAADRVPVAPQFEYPSRLVSVPQPRPAGGSGGGSGSSGSAGSGSSGGSLASNFDSGSRTRRRATEFDEPPFPTTSTQSLPPAGVGSGGVTTTSTGSGTGTASGPAPGPAPQAAPPENEVTVIRGTEKTRVLVPR